MLKTRLTAAATVLAAALALTACGDSTGPAGPLPTAGADADAIATVLWSIGEDEFPHLDFEGPIEVESDGARLISAGDGAPLEPGQTLSLDYVLFNGDDAERLTSTYEFGGSQTVVFDEAQLSPTIVKVLTGQNVGAEFIYATPDYSAAREDGTFPTMLLATVITDAYTIPDRAEGTAVDPVDGLPPVTLDATGKPSVDLSDTEPADELVAQLLIESDGPPVATGQSLTVHYTGWTLDGEQFDSSWDRGEPSTFTFAPGSLIEGWVQGLTGVPVGSQVLLVIPAELAYGEQGQNGIPPGATLVFVVDVLAAT